MRKSIEQLPIDANQPGPDAGAPCDVGGDSFTIEFWLRGLLEDNNTSNAGGDVETWGVDWINGNIIIDREILGDGNSDWGISIAGGHIRFGTGAGDGGDDPVTYLSFNGYVDELRIWAVARTPQELQATYNRVIVADSPGLVGYYPMFVTLRYVPGWDCRS